MLVLTTTAPLVYLAWNSLHRIDLGMPWLSGFAGVDNFAKMGSDPRFWNSLRADRRSTPRRRSCCRSLVGLSLALLVLQIPKGQGVLRVAAILPIVLAPVVVGLFWRTLVLAPDVGLVDMVTRALGLRQPQLARRPAAGADLGDRDPHLAVDAVRLPRPARDALDAAARRLRGGAPRPRRRLAALPSHTLPLIRPAIVMVVILRTMTALSAFAAIFAATGGGPGSATEILNLYAYRTSFTELNLGYGAALAVVLLAITLAISYFMFRLREAAHEAALAARTTACTLGVATLALAPPARLRRALCDRRRRPRRLGVPGRLGPADVVQDRARRARLPAGLSSSRRRSPTTAR